MKGALWACFLFPSLPLDVFARAQSPGRCGTSVRRRQRRPLSARRGGQRRGTRRGRSRRPARVRRAGALARSRAARPRRRRRGPRARASSPRGRSRSRPWPASRRPMRWWPTSARACGSSAACRGSWRALAGGAHALGYANRLGIAPTPGAALLLARAGLTQGDRRPRAPARSARVRFRSPSSTSTTRRATRCAKRASRRSGRPPRCRATGSRAASAHAIVALLDHAHGSDARSARVVRAAARFLGPPRPAGARARRRGARLRRAAARARSRRLAHRARARRDAPDAHARSRALSAPARAARHRRAVRARRAHARDAVASCSACCASGSRASRCRRRSRRSRSPATKPRRSPGRNLGLLPGDDADRVEVPLVDRLRARLGEDALVRVFAACRSSSRARDARCAIDAARGMKALRRCPMRRARSGCSRSRSRSRTSRSAAVGAARRTRAHRIRLVGRRRRAPRLLRRGRRPTATTAWIYRDHRYGIDDGEWFLHGLFA